MHFFLLFAQIVIMNICPSEMRNKYNTLAREGFRLSTHHVPTVRLKMCLLKPDVGPCRGNLKMYYYDPEAKECRSFSWGGCQGNGNRFDRKRECEQTCLTQPNEPRKKPRYCDLSFDYGFCFGAIERWYYDRLWKVCKKRIYSGCGGNKNNFYNFEQCDTICRLGKEAKPPSNKVGGSDGVRKVLYVFTNGTTKSRITVSRHYTSPQPRYYYNLSTNRDKLMQVIAANLSYPNMTMNDVSKRGKQIWESLQEKC